MPSTSRSGFRRNRRRLPALAGFLLLGLVLLPVGAPAAQPQAGTTMQAERVAVGDEAIDFALESIDGASYRLSDLRGDKNAIVIFFRGTW